MPVIDALPPDQRKAVIDALIAGQSARKVAVMAGVSRQAVDQYKARVILPAVAAAYKLQSDQVSTGDIVRDDSQFKEQSRLAKDVIRGSPLRDRLDIIWTTISASLQEAAAAKNISGVVELSAVCHANLEMLGTLTGELHVNQQQQGVGGSVQIMLGVPREGAVIQQPLITHIHQGETAGAPRLLDVSSDDD